MENKRINQYDARKKTRYTQEEIAKYRAKKAMYVTVYGLVMAYANANGKKPLNQESKTIIGKLVAEKWFSQPKSERPYIRKVKIKEGHFTNMVWSYPVSFSDTINQAIKIQYEQQLKTID